MATREQIYGALFALGQGITWAGPTTWKFTMRRVKMPDDLVDMMPALCQGEFVEHTTQRRGEEQLRTYRAAWFLYFFDGNPDAIMATTVNLVLDQIDALFPPDPQVQTLGGLVYKVWIDGDIEKYGGNIDNQMMVVVPLSLIVP